MTREENELSESEHNAQFDKDLTSESSLIMTPEELSRMNDSLETAIHQPIDWDKELE